MCYPRHPTMHQRTPNTLCQPHTTHHQIPIPDDDDAARHTDVPQQAIHPQKQTISAHQPPAGPSRQHKKNKAP